MIVSSTLHRDLTWSPIHTVKQTRQEAKERQSHVTRDIVKGNTEIVTAMEQQDIDEILKSHVQLRGN